MKKILPVKYPPVTTYLSHGYNLAALMNYEEFLPWFHSNYIHLKCLRELTQELICDLNFYFPEGLNYLQSIPFIKTQTIYKDTLSIFSNGINDFLRQVINKDYYICTFVDEYYIPGKRSFQKMHNSHRIQIHGFDDEKEIFNVCGWNKENVFGIDETVSYEEFEKAFESEYNGDIILSNRGTTCYKLETNYFRSHQYKLDIEYVYQALNDYLLSNNPSIGFGMYHNKHDSSKMNFGISVYKYVVQYLQKLEKKEADPSVIALHSILEHKKCMVMRIDYLKSLGYLRGNSIIDYKRLEKKAEISRNLMLRYLMTAKSEIIRDIINIINSIEEDERETLKHLLEDIKETNNL